MKTAITVLRKDLLLELRTFETVPAMVLFAPPEAIAAEVERAVARRNIVLQTMVGSGAIDAAEAERAKKAPVKLVNGLEMKETFGLYFKEQVRRDLVERFGWQRVSQGGLRVYTTLGFTFRLDVGYNSYRREKGVVYFSDPIGSGGASGGGAAPLRRDVGERAAQRREEPLHQQPVPDRVDPGDAEQVVDQAAGARPAGGATDAAAAGRAIR